MKKVSLIILLIAAIAFAAAMIMAGETGLTEIKLYTNENPTRYYRGVEVGPNQAANGIWPVNSLIEDIDMNADVDVTKTPPDSNQLWVTTDAAAGPYAIKFHFVTMPNPRCGFYFWDNIDASSTERITFWIKSQKGNSYPLWLRVRSANHPVDGKDVEGAYVMIDGETIVKKDPFGFPFAFRDVPFNGEWQFVSIPWDFLNGDSAAVAPVLPYTLVDPHMVKTGKHIGGGYLDLKTIGRVQLDTKEGGSQTGYPWPGGGSIGYGDYFVDEVVLTLEEGTGIVGVDGKPTVMPLTYELGNAYPNPFNPSTTIEYAIPVSNHVSLKVINLLGQAVRTLVDRYTTAGTYKVVWDGRDEAGKPVPSGIYFYRMESSHFRQVNKMMLAK